MIYIWIRGLIIRRNLRIVGTTTGIALAVALLVSLGTFLVSSSISMTSRAVSAVPIDWQVEVLPAADVKTVGMAIRKAVSVSSLHVVDYAQVDGFEAHTGHTIQTTGPGKVIAFDQNYAVDFPKEVRLLAGTLNGTLVAQQTAANLHVSVGDKVIIKRVGLGPTEIEVSGIIDLPDADALFQAVGLPQQAAPQAPPDNVLVLLNADWQLLIAPQEKMRPDSIRYQFHVRLDHTRLPANPTDAFVFVTGAARNLDARVVGQALVADNLGARLDAVRGDALYAKVLFLFLGVPGIALAVSITTAVTSTNANRRRLERALLRVRGASIPNIVAISSAEGLICGIGGILGGLGLAWAITSWTGGSASAFRPDSLSLVLSCILAVLLSLSAILLPALREGRHSTVMEARRFVSAGRLPLWEGTYADVVLLALAGLFFWQSGSTGYQIVLAPEGVAATAVDYKAFISPALFWVGAMLMTFRVTRLFVERGRTVVEVALKPIVGSLATAIAGSMARQSRRLAFGVAMLSLAVSFAVATSIFNTTFNAQALIDAELTNGSDVTVFGTTQNPAGNQLTGLASLAGVSAVPMQHRFAYVGADLQDLYGIDPTTIGEATTLSDAYFAGATAKSVLSKLGSTPNGVLVSEETVKDFQLTLGDALNLRLMNEQDRQYHSIPFRFVGVVREFPTAPKDSFLVANSAYISKVTGSEAQEYVLMKTIDNPGVVANSVRKLVSNQLGLKVKDIAEAVHLIGSSLTAIDLNGLTGIELAFAAIMVATASGLLLLLGLFERRRAFAVLSVIGARPLQIAAFIWSEGVIVLFGGLIFGSAAGILIAEMLVKLLTGVFDPPPEALTWPVGYLSLIVFFVLASTAIALGITSRTTARPSIGLLRDL